MKSATPKVLHELCGRTLVGHVLAAARELTPENLVAVVGHAPLPDAGAWAGVPDKRHLLDEG